MENKDTGMIMKKSKNKTEMMRYELMEHPNGQYWKVKDIETGREYAKQDAVKLLNDLQMKSKTVKDIEKALQEPIYITDTSKIFEDNNYQVKHYTFYSLIMEQVDKINELEQMLDDVELELEELEQENRRLCSLL